MTVITQQEMAEESPDAVERINTNEGATSDNILSFLNLKTANIAENFNPLRQTFIVKNNILLKITHVWKRFY